MGASLLEFRALREWASDSPEGFQELVRWINEYLCQPHPEVGRAGPVCPFVPKAVKQDLLDVAFVPPDVTTVEAIVQMVRYQTAAFIERHGWCPSRQPASIMVFSHFTRSDCQELLLPAHREAKPEVVSQGLMLGEFFPGYDLPGLRNRNFRAGEAPLPMLVIRRMVRQDSGFLIEGPPELYRSYLERFGMTVEV